MTFDDIRNRFASPWPKANVVAGIAAMRAHNAWLSSRVERAAAGDEQAQREILDDALYNLALLEDDE